MRVLLISENWPPRVGGIENYLTNIAKHLGKDMVTVIEPSTRRFFWPLIKPAWLPLYISIHRLVKREEFDVILCGKALFEGLVGYYLKKHLGIPYVVFTYAMEIETWSKNPREKRKLERVLKNANRVVYINDVTKKALLALGVTEKQLVKIWPGVDERYFSSIITSPYQGEVGRLGDRVRLSKPYILTVSRLIPRKGIDMLIKAFAQIETPSQLVIAGDGPEREKLEALTKKLGLADKLKFLGFVPDEDLPALYSNSLFFALTPREVEGDIEGFGIVYLEAAACGIPSIATKTGGAGEAVINNETGLVIEPVFAKASAGTPEHERTVNAIRDAMKYLLTHPHETQELGWRARKRALDQFRWSKRILLVKGMLDAILSKQHSNGSR